MTSTFTTGEHPMQPYTELNAHRASTPSDVQFPTSSEDYPLALQPRTLNFSHHLDIHHGVSQVEDTFSEYLQRSHVPSPNVMDDYGVTIDATHLPLDNHYPGLLNALNPATDTASWLALFDTYPHHGSFSPVEVNPPHQDITRNFSFASSSTTNSAIAGSCLSGTGLRPPAEHLTDASIPEPGYPSALNTDPFGSAHPYQVASRTGFEMRYGESIKAPSPVGGCEWGGIQPMDGIAYRSSRAELLPPPSPPSQAYFEPQGGIDFPLFEHGDVIGANMQTPAYNMEIELVERNHDPDVNVVNNRHGGGGLQRPTPLHAKHQSKTVSPAKKRTATAIGKAPHDIVLSSSIVSLAFPALNRHTIVLYSPLRTPRTPINNHTMDFFVSLNYLVPAPEETTVPSVPVDEDDGGSGGNSYCVVA
ncbi:hypothetical protein CONPUDRAFT_150688 [Coniophora puteana RWD-64-598 SS2]|uniref:Uncharacterized protein n=1 Tax=Coniophora puteana (strain RWD-64-598) TaxID=741705 RepID=A0A5M3MWU6_CONPW|nr:uncharacterized protein CONPUDRAFT_150688 [Coniophora puteana RWD-64-598 SS2]EIW83612.1 hypothetical protein CONPUDRAFT_150688 [Coniophora puteana RWD-64-598 SS2]